MDQDLLSIPFNESNVKTMLASLTNENRSCWNGEEVFLQVFWRFPACLPFPSWTSYAFHFHLLQSLIHSKPLNHLQNTWYCLKHAGCKGGHVARAGSAGLRATHHLQGKSECQGRCCLVWHGVWWWCGMICSGVGMCGSTVVPCHAVWTFIVNFTYLRLLILGLVMKITIF